MFKFTLLTKFSASISIIIAAIILRGFFLEYTDLIDPTETRYASIAQEMYISGDWLTPKIHQGEGLIPYLGKPPLHFWLTAFFYKIFGMEEWTARLPSFLSGLVILLLSFKFTRKYFDLETALISILILFSSVMFFFLSGASVTDVTLTALITASIYFLYSFIRDDKPQPYFIYLAVIFCALSFLCKGPVSVALVFLPFVLYSAVNKDFQWPAKINWTVCAFIFFLITGPWFVANEITNPGFIKYFIWNENISRYLFKEYGDKYGTGHVYKYGSAWIMFFAAFLPWTIIFTYKFFSEGFNKSLKFIKSDKDRVFIACWAISAPLFFTFIRQLHAMYIIPSIPAAAMLTAAFFNKETSTINTSRFSLTAFFSAAIVFGLVFGCRLFIEFSALPMTILLVITLCGLIYIYKRTGLMKNIQAANLISAFFICFYSIAALSITPHINDQKSSESILRELSKNSIDNRDYRKVGVTGNNIFSHYFTSYAWENELGSRIDLQYFDPEQTINKDLEYILLQDKKDELPDQIYENFKLAIDKGTWKIYKKTLIKN